nr:hypothetical protein [Tanacetum cinerariifolium]
MSARGHGHSQHPEHGDSKLVDRSAEIERLASDKQKLSASHVALRQELAATLQDIHKLRVHIGSIQTESDLQIRILLDKMAKMEVHIRAGENVKKDLQKAHGEARALVATRQELINQVEQAAQELKNARADVEKLPQMNAELDRLRQEHQKLRSTFEHEKSLNNEKVAQMELMEKELVGMGKEVERLRAEIQNSEKRANAPMAYMNQQEIYSQPQPQPQPQPPPPMPAAHVHAAGGGYVDAYGNVHHVQMGVGGEGMVPYGGNYPGQVAPSGNGNYSGQVPPSGNYPGQVAAGGNPQWRPPPQMAPYSGPLPVQAPPGGHPQWGAPQPAPPPYDISYSIT